MLQYHNNLKEIILLRNHIEKQMVLQNEKKKEVLIKQQEWKSRVKPIEVIAEGNRIRIYIRTDVIREYRFWFDIYYLLKARWYIYKRATRSWVVQTLKYLYCPLFLCLCSGKLFKIFFVSKTKQTNSTNVSYFQNLIKRQ